MVILIRDMEKGPSGVQRREGLQRTPSVERTIVSALLGVYADDPVSSLPPEVKQVLALPDIQIPLIAALSPRFSSFKEFQQAPSMVRKAFIRTLLTRMHDAGPEAMQRILAAESNPVGWIPLEAMAAVGKEFAHPAMLEEIVAGRQTAAFLETAQARFPKGYEEVARVSDIASRQSGDALVQSIAEAISNGRDALQEDQTIGQFGVGIKQALEWLHTAEPTKATIQVLTKNKEGKVFLIEVKKGHDGAFYARFRQPTRQDIDRIPTQTGTSIAITGIPAARYKQKIEKSMQKRFKLADGARISINGTEINNTQKKTLAQHHISSRQGEIHVTIDEGKICITDSGRGMDASTLYSMFYPHTTKGMQLISHDQMWSYVREHGHITLFDAGKKGIEVAFARNGEIIPSLSAPVEIAQNNTGKSIGIDLGLGLKVSQGRSGFTIDRSFPEAIRGVLSLAEAAGPAERLDILSALVASIRSLGKDSNGDMRTDDTGRYVQEAVKIIADDTKRWIEKLLEQGYVLLPNRPEYQKIAVDAQKVLFADPFLLSYGQDRRKIFSENVFTRLGMEEGITTRDGWQVFTASLRVERPTISSAMTPKEIVASLQATQQSFEPFILDEANNTVIIDTTLWQAIQQASPEEREVLLGLLAIRLNPINTSYRENPAEKRIVFGTPMPQVSHSEWGETSVLEETRALRELPRGLQQEIIAKTHLSARAMRLDDGSMAYLSFDGTLVVQHTDGSISQQEVPAIKGLEPFPAPQNFFSTNEGLVLVGVKKKKDDTQLESEIVGVVLQKNGQITEVALPLAYRDIDRISSEPAQIFAGSKGELLVYCPRKVGYSYLPDRIYSVSLANGTTTEINVNILEFIDFRQRERGLIKSLGRLPNGNLYFIQEVLQRDGANSSYRERHFFMYAVQGSQISQSVSLGQLPYVEGYSISCFSSCDTDGTISIQISVDGQQTVFSGEYNAQFQPMKPLQSYQVWNASLVYPVGQDRDRIQYCFGDQLITFPKGMPILDMYGRYPDSARPLPIELLVNTKGKQWAEYIYLLQHMYPGTEESRAYSDLLRSVSDTLGAKIEKLQSPEFHEQFLPLLQQAWVTYQEHLQVLYSGDHQMFVQKSQEALSHIFSFMDRFLLSGATPDELTPELLELAFFVIDYSEVVTTKELGEISAILQTVEDFETRMSVAEIVVQPMLYKLYKMPAEVRQSVLERFASLLQGSYGKRFIQTVRKDEQGMHNAIYYFNESLDASTISDATIFGQYLMNGVELVRRTEPGAEIAGRDILPHSIPSIPSELIAYLRNHQEGLRSIPAIIDYIQEHGGVESVTQQHQEEIDHYRQKIIQAIHGSSVDDSAINRELVQNARDAIRATGKSGEVTVDTYVEHMNDGDRLVLSFADTGKGMTLDEMLSFLVPGVSHKRLQEDQKGFFGMGIFLAFKGAREMEVETTAWENGRLKTYTLRLETTMHKGQVSGIVVKSIIEHARPASTTGTTVKIRRDASEGIPDLDAQLFVSSLLAGPAVLMSNPEIAGTDITFYRVDGQGERQRFEAPVSTVLKTYSMTTNPRAQVQFIQCDKLASEVSDSGFPMSSLVANGYLDLVPKVVRQLLLDEHISVVVSGLPLTIDRSQIANAEQKNELQRIIATEALRLAAKHVEKGSPLSGVPDDLYTNNSYWIGKDERGFPPMVDPRAMKISETINQGKAISDEDIAFVQLGREQLLQVLAGIRWQESTEERSIAIKAISVFASANQQSTALQIAHMFSLPYTPHILPQDSFLVTQAESQVSERSIFTQVTSYELSDELSEKEKEIIRYFAEMLQLHEIVVFSDEKARYIGRYMQDTHSIELNLLHFSRLSPSERIQTLIHELAHTAESIKNGISGSFDVSGHLTHEQEGGDFSDMYRLVNSLLLSLMTQSSQLPN